jgi:hypothetical protein
VYATDGKAAAMKQVDNTGYVVEYGFRMRSAMEDGIQKPRPWTKKYSRKVQCCPEDAKEAVPGS